MLDYYKIYTGCMSRKWLCVASISAAAVQNCLHTRVSQFLPRRGRFSRFLQAERLTPRAKRRGWTIEVVMAADDTSVIPRHIKPTLYILHRTCFSFCSFFFVQTTLVVFLNRRSLVHVSLAVTEVIERNGLTI